MQVGRDKGAVWSTDSKLLGLDEPYVHVNGTVRAVLRIDLDRIFESWGDLYLAVEELALPCLPSVVVGREDDKGRVRRPHVLFFLPYGAGVWFSDDPRCRRDIMDLWRGVLAGITRAFLPLGADPGGLSNPTKIKNPLSPFWDIRVWNETVFPTLGEWAEWVDTSRRRRDLAKEAAAGLSGMTKKASNALFTDIQALAFEALRTWHRAGDADYVRAILMKDRDAIAERLFREFVGGASASAGNPKQAQAILYRVTTYAADHWDPSKCSLRAARDVGACAEAVAQLNGTSARQAVGARHTHATRRSRSADAIREAIDAARAAGEPVTVSGIARCVGKDRKTVRANWPSGEPAA
ncbi:hypothetical protein GCM10011390_39700 [Aureimonas endophytica]|jgi:hypothetical protein|uniref:Primase C-terminal 1 domain-containing protein n=1 Tax=Aureimonas endophytica TaxID=2027858 RepID=A0A916ZX47_9HYPH|nr:MULTISPECIES: hypothetical protein [Aureimonas]GGE16684.1 hypothetical protein GCM10011390_39700 [Aureimonas endophytica]